MFFVSAAFIDGNTGLVDAQSAHYTETEGKDFSIQLPFKLRRGSGIYLCRNDCKREDILIETYETRAEKGRYVIRYDNSVVHVVIKMLIQSDAGWYTVGSPSRGSYREFEIEIRGKFQLKLIPSMAQSQQKHNILYKNIYSLKLAINRNFTIRVLVLKSAFVSLAVYFLTSFCSY